MSKINSSTKVLLSSTSLGGFARQMAFAFTGLLVAATPAWAIDDNALPTGGNVAAGQAGFDYAGNHLNVNQGSQNVVIDWNSFNIGQNATTQFNQPNAAAIAVNRVHDVNPSQILGTLRANGQVVVLNTNGVVFGQNATVDVAGLLVSTGEIDQDAFMKNGQIKLDSINAKNGAIVNNGNINVAGGLAAFIAPQFINNGVIQANLGKIEIAAGADKATVDMYGDGLVELALNDKASKAVINNNGTLRANGGKINITVKAAKDIVDNVVNMGGIVEANSFSEKNGVINLDVTNADVNVTGKINAKGGNGKVAVRSNKNIRVTETAEINADAGTVGNGGTVDLIAEQSMVYLGSISARGGSQSGNGGNAEVSGHQTLGFDGLVNLGASNGEAGTLLLDPSFVVIHSGAVPFGLVQNYVVSADKIALSLLFNNVKIEADNFIDVGTSKTGYTNQNWTGNAFNDAIITAALNTLLGNGNIDVSKSLFTTTSKNLTLQSDTVNFNRDIKLGNGNLIVDAGTINLDSKVLDKNGVVITNDARLDSNADEINVKSSNALINQAVLFAKDAGGTVVNVASGIYNESLAIAKSLTLNGNNKAVSGDATRNAETKITGANGIAITADNVTIDGFTIDDGNLATGTAGVSAVNAKNAKIKNNIIKNVANGILVSNNANGAILSGNAISNTSSDGIRVSDSNDAQIKSNVVSITAGDGIKAISSNAGTPLTGIIVQDNKVSDTERVGIYTENVFGALIKGNNVANAKRYAGIYSYGGGNMTIDGNTISQSAETGILVKNSAPGFTFIQNNIIDSTGQSLKTSDGENSGDAIRVLNSNGLFAFNNKIGQTGQIKGNGIFFDPTDYANIILNTINNVTDNGIYSQDNSFAKIQQNTITSTGKNGILIEGGTENTVGGTGNGQANNITGAGTNGVELKETTKALVGFNKINTSGQQGVNVFKSDDATVNKNTINGTVNNGISLEASNRAKITGNTISNAGVDGINLTYGNTFAEIIGNTIQALRAGIKLETAGGQNNDNAIIGKAGAGNGNTISAGQEGIVTDSASNLKIENNAVNSATTGIAVKGGSTQYIFDNTIRNASVAAIDVKDVTGVINQIYFNKIDASADGIRAKNAASLLIMDNRIGLNAALTGNGIIVDTSNGAKVLSNQISNVGKTGIRVNKGTDVELSDNVLKKIGNEGIRTEQVQQLLIQRNNLDNVSWTAIQIEGGKDATVSRNKINDARGHGIQLNGTNGSSVTGNTISKIRLTGIITNGLTGTNAINTNIVSETGAGGIKVTTGKNTTINDNQLYTIVGNAIDVRNTAAVQVTNNTIGAKKTGLISQGTDNVKGDGIVVSGSNGAVIKGNYVTETTLNGINSLNNSNAFVQQNTIVSADLNGVLIEGGTENTVGGAGQANIIKNSGVSGVQVTNSGKAVVSFNDIDGGGVSTDSGVRLDGSNNATVNSNKIKNTQIDGIRAFSSNGLIANKNIISDLAGSGIGLAGSNNSHAEDNQISNVGRGFWVGNSDDAEIIHNTITDATTYGVLLTNYGGASTDAVIAKNIITNGEYGVYLEGSATADINDNDITNATVAGIAVTDSTATVWKNRISSLAAKGIVLLNAAGSYIGHTSQDSKGNVIQGTSTGIQVENSDNVTLAHNTIKDTADGWNNSGINIKGGSDLTVRDNTLKNVGGHGIYAEGPYNGPTTTLNITGNKIKDTEYNAIYIKKWNGALIAGNTINGTDFGHGILLELTNNTTVNGGNTIKNVAENGINLFYGNDQTVIEDNTIVGGKAGIALQNTGGQFNKNTTIEANTIKDSLKGISIDQGSVVTIAGNNIHDTAEEGVWVNKADDVVIEQNDIKRTGKDGVYATLTSGLQVIGNTIKAVVSGNGITSVKNNFAEINDNTIKNIAGNGIDVDGGRAVVVNDNNISDAVQGIAVSNLKGNSKIRRNVINNVSDDAIHAENTKRLTVTGNKIGMKAGSTIGGTAISIDGATKVRIANNKIGDAALDGIFINDVQEANIRNNTVKATGKGIVASNADLLNVANNTINSNDNGIDTDGVVNQTIENNTITSVNGNGINLANINTAVVNNNTVNDNSKYGLFLAPGGNGSLVLTNNVINSLMNGVGARFEDGRIDLSGAANTFNGGTNGLEFNGSTVSLVGNTFGTTEFNGQSGYYIALSNAALFGPLTTPAVLDARQVNFDGFTPGAFTLSFADWQRITSKLYDYNDDSTLGLIFFDYPVTDINDILPQQRMARRAANPVASVTIMGLPYASLNFTNNVNNVGTSVPSAGTNAAFTVAANTSGSPFDLVTAAGPKAGKNVQTADAAASALNDIETAAGGSQTAGCWGQVYSKLGTTAVTYNMDASPDAMLNDQAACN